MNNKPDEIENLLHDEDLEKAAGGRKKYDMSVRPEVVQEYFNKYLPRVRMRNYYDFKKMVESLLNEPITYGESSEVIEKIRKWRGIGVFD